MLAEAVLDVAKEMEKRKYNLVMGTMPGRPEFLPTMSMVNDLNYFILALQTAVKAAEKENVD